MAKNGRRTSSTSRNDQNTENFIRKQQINIGREWIGIRSDTKPPGITPGILLESNPVQLLLEFTIARVEYSSGKLPYRVPNQN